MVSPIDILAHIVRPRVLDVATGSGGFIHFLLAGLPDFEEIIGVDSSSRAALPFSQTFREQPKIYYLLGDAAQLSFEPETFDLVCVSNSLHHFNEPLSVLREMMRVLRPGGHLLVSEMYCDDQTQEQLTHVLLHHWWAAVDMIHGIYHRETYRRQELVCFLNDCGLRSVTFYDLADSSSDPKDPEVVRELEPVFERYTQRAAGYPELQARGEQLRSRVEEIGFHSASTLVGIGKKQSANIQGDAG